MQALTLRLCTSSPAQRLYNDSISASFALAGEGCPVNDDFPSRALSLAAEATFRCATLHQASGHPGQIPKRVCYTPEKRRPQFARLRF
jgi:hypothetical protein